MSYIELTKLRDSDLWARFYCAVLASGIWTGTAADDATVAKHAAKLADAMLNEMTHPTEE